MAPNGLSPLNLHCLPFSFQHFSETPISNNEHIQMKDGRVQFTIIGAKGLIIIFQYIYMYKLEMCQYDTDAPAQGHPHPQKNEVEKRAITLIIIGRFYPKSNLTIFYDHVPRYKI